LRLQKGASLTWCVGWRREDEREGSIRETYSADKIVFLIPPLSSFLLFSTKGPSRSSRDGVSLSIARSADRDAKRELADRVLDAHEALKCAFSAASGSEAHEKHRQHFLSLLPPPSGRGRQEKQPGTEMLPPSALCVANLATVAKIFNVLPKDLEAAQRRRRRARLSSHGHNMRSKGTHEEKLALAQFVNAMARNHMAQPREAVAAVLKEMLRSRDCAYSAAGGGARRRLRLPPLSSSERSFLEGRTGLGTEWFIRWEQQYGIMPVTKASLQSEKRATSFTVNACVEHFKRLEDALAAFGFVVLSGAHKGKIKTDGTLCCYWLPSSAQARFSSPLSAALDLIITVDEVPGLKTGIAGKVYGQAGATQDSAVVAEQEHNLGFTLVWAFSMRGVAVPPMLIEKLGKGSHGRVMRPRRKPKHFLEKYPAVIWAGSETGFINTRIFIEWARNLRQYVGHTQPLVLLSDGHSTRTNVDVVNELLALNIHLFLIPSNTSHALAASDQFHQHIHRRRFVLEQKLRIETNSVLHREDKVECLLESVTQCTDMCSLMRTAFHHAGIGRELRSITLLKNQPAPDPEPLAPLSRTQSAEGSEPSDTVTPTSSQVSVLSPPSMKRALRHSMKTGKRDREALRAVVEAQAEIASARPRDLREERERRRAQRVSVPLHGLMADGEVYAQLQERKANTTARLRAQAKAHRLRELGEKVRAALGDSTHRGGRPVKPELVAYLTFKGIAFPRNARHAQLLSLVASDLQIDVDSPDASDDDMCGPDGAMSDLGEEAETVSDDDDTLVLAREAPIGLFASTPPSYEPVHAPRPLLAPCNVDGAAAAIEATTAAASGEDGVEHENQPVFQVKPDFPRMRALIAQRPIAMREMWTRCQELAALEDEKEKNEKKEKRKE
jgi:hypothetical protein